MHEFFKHILGLQGYGVLEFLSKSSESIASYISPRVIVSWLRQVGYGEVNIPESCPLVKLSKSGYGYSGLINISEIDYNFENVSEEHIAAMITVASGQEVKQTETKDIDLAKLAKTIDLLVKAQGVQYERTQSTQYLEPEQPIEPQSVQTKQVAKPTIPKLNKVEPVLDNLGLAEIKEGGRHFKTGKPVEFNYVHSKHKTQYFGSRFGQDIEPAGKYVNHAVKYGDPSPDWETGKIRFNNPLVIKLRPTKEDFTYGPNGWKARLSKHFKAKGLKLSHKLLQTGYDGIVTVHHDGKDTSEIVDLRPASQYTKPKRRKLIVMKSEAQKACGLCGQKIFDNNQFVGCTCFKPLAKNISIVSKPLSFTLTFDETVDEDALLALIGALKHGK